MEQRELVHRARRGDGDAFAALVQPHLGDMVRLAGLIAAGAGDAEDIVQEAMIKALRSLSRFDAERPFRPWFATIVANQARNAQRSRLRRSRLADRIAAFADLPSRDTDDLAITNVEGSALLTMVLALDAIDREVLGLRFLLGLSERETAEAMSCSIGTVKSRTSRALVRVRSLMNDTDEPQQTPVAVQGDRHER